MQEKEILSFITESDFELYKSQFKFDKYYKRLTIQISDFNNTNIDTRIRITNGEVELIQKIGSWNSKTHEEINLKIPNKSHEISNAIKILKNFINTKNINIIQFDNFIFENDEYELKLTKQFGKKSQYSYEIEVKDLDLDPITIAKNLKLKINLPQNTPEFWTKFNNETNLNYFEISDKELISIIQSYL